MFFSKKKSTVLSDTEKAQLRKDCLKKREAISEGYATISSRAVVTHVLSLITRDACIAGYQAIRGELDIGVLLRVLAERGNPVCLPVVTQKYSPLSFYVWKPGDKLVKGSYGIATPESSVPQLEPDVLLVPLVGFDKKCHRLGYGAGYYDRTLEGLKKTKAQSKTIGIAYADQQVPSVPVEKHDVALDCIVTERGIIQP